MGANCYSA